MVPLVVSNLCADSVKTVRGDNNIYIYKSTNTTPSLYRHLLMLLSAGERKCERQHDRRDAETPTQLFRQLMLCMLSLTEIERVECF